MTPPRMTEAVLGFRAWSLTPIGLRSRTRAASWSPGVNVAQCEPVSDFSTFDTDRPATVHHAPDENCGCGLYAWHSLDTLRKVRNGDADPLVYGAVAGWGRTFVHYQGWRSERARILALAVAPNATSFYLRLVEAAAREYGVPVVPLSMLMLEGARHASPVPDEHIPEFTGRRPAAQAHVHMSVRFGSSGTAAQMAQQQLAHLQHAAAGLQFVTYARPRNLTKREQAAGLLLACLVPPVAGALLDAAGGPLWLAFPIAITWGAAVAVGMNNRRSRP